MPRSWLYHFFPEAKIDEEKRSFYTESSSDEIALVTAVAKRPD